MILKQSFMTQKRNPEKLATPTNRTGQFQDTPVDVKLVLSALWIAMLFVFAYVDIFGLFREDVLRAALDGKISGTTLSVDQMFLTGTLIYILLPSLMVVLSLVLRPRVNRMTNIAVSVLYSLTIAYSCLGETWVYYLLGSAIEVVLLISIAGTAWKWPRREVTL